MSLTSHPNIIKELFLYFAKFPNRDNLLKRFRKQEAEVHELFRTYYADVRQQLEAMPDGEHSLCAGLEDMVFTSSEDYLKKQIEDMDGVPYMFLDYGDINRVEATTTKGKRDTFALAVTVAMQWKPDDIDAIEHAALSDYLLNLLRCIIAQMQADQATCSGTKQVLMWPHTIVPFYARELQNSIGWTLSFNRWNIDLI